MIIEINQQPMPAHIPNVFRYRRGFTLVELLTVIAIIGVLAAILVPVASRVRYSARISQCASNLRQIFMAFELYAVDHQNKWPPIRIPAADQNFPYLLRDYVPMKSKYGGGAALNIYMCPEGVLQNSSKASVSYYGVNKYLYGEGSSIGISDEMAKDTPKSRVTSPSRTILLADTCIQSNGNPASSIGYGSGGIPGTLQGPTPAEKKHAKGSANIAYADGHVKFFPNTYQLSETKYRDQSTDDLWSAVK